MKRNGNAAAIHMLIVAVATFLAVQSKTISAKSGNQAASRKGTEPTVIDHTVTATTG